MSTRLRGAGGLTVMAGHTGHPVPPGWSELKRSRSITELTRSITERAMDVSGLTSSVSALPAHSFLSSTRPTKGDGKMAPHRNIRFVATIVSHGGAARAAGQRRGEKSREPPRTPAVPDRAGRPTPNRNHTARRLRPHRRPSCKGTARPIIRPGPAGSTQIDAWPKAEAKRCRAP